MALPTASDNKFPKLVVAEAGTLGTVAAGSRRLGIDANGVLVWKDSAGATSPLAALNKWDATAAPDADNDVDEGYAVGSRWIDVTNDKEYVCLDATDGAAVWTETTASGSSVPPDGDGAVVATDETTATTSYTDLTTPGPAVTVTVPASGKVLIGWSAQLYDVTGNAFMSVALSGENTVAATDDYCLFVPTAAGSGQFAFATMLEGLTPGSTTFTCKYRAGGGNPHWLRRRIWAIPIT